MAATSIQFIQNPLYRVDFRQYSKHLSAESFSLASRLKNAVMTPLFFIKIVFFAIGKAAYETLRYSGSSFKHIVLGYYGSLILWRPPSDLYLVVFKIVFWVAAMGWCFATTAVRLVYKQTQNDTDNRAFLSRFAGNELDLEHIVTPDSEIDVSGVPAEISVNKLLQMFQEINFTDSNLPGYMAPTSRKEGNTQYTKEELNKSLQTFVGNINQRKAFLGTPPSYDTPRLLAYYQQIENAVRFSIWKSDQALNHFRTTNGIDPTAYQGAILQQYKNILEDRARIPLMLAIAGKHCGARYMGEAMELYDGAVGENVMARGTLRDALIDLLAAKRKEIAKSHIQTHLVQGNSQSTHAYNSYMSNLGKTLAIPGAAKVIEHLLQEFDRPRFLRLFFEDYTVDSIHELVQAKIKKSQLFREKIIDWLKTQPGTWQHDGVKSLAEVMDEANAILTNNQLAENFVPYQSLKELKDLIANLKEPVSVFLDLEEFCFQLFASSSDWLTGKYPGIINRSNVKQEMKSLFSTEQLGQDLITKTKEAIAGNKQLAIGPFTSRLLALQKVDKLCRVTGLNADTAMRVVKKEKDLQQALEEQRAQHQSNDFVQSLSLENIAQSGLSPEMLEWVLVSQGILLSQVGK